MVAPRSATTPLVKIFLYQRKQALRKTPLFLGNFYYDSRYEVGRYPLSFYDQRQLLWITDGAECWPDSLQVQWKNKKISDREG